MIASLFYFLFLGTFEKPEKLEQPKQSKQSKQPE